MSLVRLIARPMLASIFLVQGYKTLRDPKPVLPAAEKLTASITPALEQRLPAVPTDPQTLVRINGAAQLAGGVGLATGTFPRISSLVLAGTLVPTTLAGHPYWEKEDPVERNQQRIQVLKNVGLAGGLLLAAVDRKRRKRPRRQQHT